MDVASLKKAVAKLEADPALLHSSELDFERVFPRQAIGEERKITEIDVDIDRLLCTCSIKPSVQPAMPLDSQTAAREIVE